LFEAFPVVSAREFNRVIQSAILTSICWSCTGCNRKWAKEAKLQHNGQYNLEQCALPGVDQQAARALMVCHRIRQLQIRGLEL